MRSYTNKDGERISVSEEHLNTAIKIKKELQSASPSRKASMKQLVKMMEVEGFNDAEASENYRCLLKAYQKSVGELPEAPKYAEMVAEGTLESIKEIVGEIAYEKRESQHVLKELNRVKREVIDFTLMAKQIDKTLKEYDWSEFKINVEPKSLTEHQKRLIVVLSDLHIGALVNTDVNTYNFEIAKKRLEKFANKVIKKAEYNNVTHIDVVLCGDAVEHSNMRYGQAFDCEFTYSEQIVRASDVIIKFLTTLTKEGYSVTYAGFAGNHDRATDKDKNLNGDHAVRPINHIIKTFIENADLIDLTYVQTKDYSYALLNINGANFKFVHGDLDSFKDENLVAKHSAIDGVQYDAVIMGHFHHFRQIEVGMGKQIIMFGSLKGSDEYSQKLRRLSIASQGMIIVDVDGDYEAKSVNLQKEENDNCE